MWALERETIANQQILVADDDPATRELLQDVLVDAGYKQVRPVARHAVVAEARREPPALLLLDVHGADPAQGRALLHRLRRDPHTASTAVIICSTMQRELWQRAGQGCDGGDGYLEKPFQIDALLAQIQALLGPPPVTGPLP